LRAHSRNFVPINNFYMEICALKELHNRNGEGEGELFSHA
jgi:hypothetical protein